MMSKRLSKVLLCRMCMGRIVDSSESVKRALDCSYAGTDHSPFHLKYGWQARGWSSGGSGGSPLLGRCRSIRAPYLNFVHESQNPRWKAIDIGKDVTSSGIAESEPVGQRIAVLIH